MGKRLKAAERRDQILDAAARAFAERGFEGTRMDDVAEEAGVAKGLLYKHFPSKDALFEALLDRQGEWFARALRDLMSGAPTGASPESLLQRGFALWVDQAASTQPGFNFAHAGRHDPYDTLRERMRDEIVGVFLSQEPTADLEPTRLLATAVQGAAEAMVLEWTKRPGDMHREEVIWLLAHFCWEGLRGLRALLVNTQAAETAEPAAR